MSLAIGKRGQNVRLAARLTGWDVDILTPEEFNKGLDAMAETLRSVEGVTEEQLDRLAALGMISVFDIEEVGVDVLVGEIEMDEAVAQAAVEAASARAKVIAEQQEREKEEAEKRKAEEAEAARRLLDGDLDSAGDADMAAAAILGLGSAEKSDDSSGPEVTEDDDARAEAILSGDSDSEKKED
ncbi:MAG: hypothetical protein NXI14_10685 [bacterium]|nr:hypothetical protein [bacterium]